MTDTPNDIALLREALKPCPFCGGKPRLDIGKVAFEDAEVSCDGCGSCGPNHDDGFGRQDNARVAVSAWNTRAALAPGQHDGAAGEGAAIRYDAAGQPDLSIPDDWMPGAGVKQIHITEEINRELRSAIQAAEEGATDDGAQPLSQAEIAEAVGRWCKPSTEQARAPFDAAIIGSAQAYRDAMAIVQADPAGSLAKLSEQARAEGEQTYAVDDRGLFCRHCGRASWLHHRVIGAGNFCVAPDATPSSDDGARR